MIVAQLAVGNASLVEMIWTLIGLGGIYYNIYNLRDALGYTKALRKMNGKTLAAVRRMRVIAYGDFRNEVFRTAISSIFIVVGIAAMLSPPTSNTARVTVLRHRDADGDRVGARPPAETLLAQGRVGFAQTTREARSPPS
jgi:uncharacterized membrane protein YuzA (DUF378 family)